MKTHASRLAIDGVDSTNFRRVILFFAFSGCSSPGPWGHGRTRMRLCFRSSRLAAPGRCLNVFGFIFVTKVACQ
jgi:hypothetical protein